MHDQAPQALKKASFPERLQKWIVRRYQGRADQKHHLDYRTLCEGLRVQFYWRLAGLTDSVGDYYLTRQKNELDWIHSSVRSWAILVETSKPTDTKIPCLRDRLAAVRKHWVLHQLNYYIKSAYTNRLSSIAFRELGAGLLFASILSSFFLALWGLRELHQWKLFIALVSFFGSVVLIHATAKDRETSEEAREDADELARIDRYSDDHKEIKRASGLGKALSAFWLWPLYDACHGGADRPKPDSLALYAFRYGMAIGLGATILLVRLPGCFALAQT